MEKHIKFFLAVILILLFFINKSNSQGLRTVICLEREPDIGHVMAAGDNGKVLRSTNSGYSWTILSTGAIDFKCSAVTDTIFWIGASNGTVYQMTKSVNTMIPVNAVSPGSINGIHMRGSGNSAFGFVCCDNGLVYRTTNSGINWTLKNSGLPNVRFNSISFFGGIPDLALGVVVGNNGNAFYSTNGGNNWTQYTTNTTKNLLSVSILTDGFFIGGEDGVLFRHDGYPSPGGSLVAVNLKTKSNINVVSGISTLNCKIGGEGGFIRNSQVLGPGPQLLENFEKLPLLPNIVSIACRNPTAGYAISSKTDLVIKYTNASTNWTLTGGASLNLSWDLKLNENSGIGNTLCVNPNNKDELYVVYGNRIYRSMDRAENWQFIGNIGASSGTVTNAHSFYVHPLDTNIMICAIESSPTDKVVTSTNYGATWTTVASVNFSNYGMPLEMDQNNPDVIYFAPEGGQFWKSTNRGITFNPISSNSFRSPCDIIVKWGNSNEILVADGVTSASQPADIFKSTDGGIGWVKVHTNPSGSGASEIPCMANTIYNTSLNYCTNWSSNNRYKSTNSGNNWTAIEQTSFSGWAVDICKVDPNFIVSGSYGPNTSITTNGGTNWNAYTLPANGCGAGLMVIERGYIVLQQCSGLFKLNIQESIPLNSNEQQLAGIPSDYSLYQNHPNPFNPSTEIRYDVKSAGNVSLKIYDMTGRFIYSLVSGFKNAGSYSVKFDGYSMASGIYYYSLEAGGNTFTKKMILVK